LAVLQRLSLPNIDRVIGALLEDTAFSLVTFVNKPKGAQSTLDAKIQTGHSVWIETKTFPNQVCLKQIKAHLESLRDGETLLLLTPDDDRPKDLPDRVAWSNFISLAEAVGDILDDEDAPPSEREAFLLREFISMLREEGLLCSTRSRVTVVAARIAWPVYKEYSVYSCQPGSSFRPSEHIAFYANGKIQPLVSKIKSVIEEIDLTQPEQFDSLDAHQKKLAEELFKKIDSSGQQQHPEFSTPHKVMFLTGTDDSETVTLEKGPITNDQKDKNGKTTAFTKGQPRYVTLESLQKASKTSELEHC
jgi:hypothetical protein